MPRKRNSTPTPVTAQISAQDTALMEWLARWKMASAPQMARRFGLSQQAVYKRVARLESHGLVAHNKRLTGVYAAYYLTAEGYTYIRSAFTFVEPKPTTIEHGFGCVDLGVTVEIKRPGNVLSEREIAVAMHAAKLTLGKQDRRRGIDLTSLRGQGPWTVHENIMHGPDLVVTDAAGALHSGEYEKTAKSDSKLKAVLIGYITDRHPGRNVCRWATVNYFCDTLAQVARIQRIAADLLGNYDTEGLEITAHLYKPRHSVPVKAGEWGHDKPAWLRKREADARAAKRAADRAAGTASF